MVVYAIVLNFYFSISLLPIWVFREATGLYNQIKYVMLITAILNLIISIALGNLIGLSGILLVHLFQEFLLIFGMNLFYCLINISVTQARFILEHS